MGILSQLNSKDAAPTILFYVRMVYTQASSLFLSYLRKQCILLPKRIFSIINNNIFYNRKYRFL